MAAKLPCTKCGAQILPETAGKYGGLCAPCKMGFRGGIRKAGSGASLVEAKRHLDWMLIDIVKTAETDDAAEYAFVADVYEPDPNYRSRSRKVGQNRGILRISKVTGTVTLVDAMPEDVGGRRFRSAATQVTKHWQAGEFPDRTVFACG